MNFTDKRIDDYMRQRLTRFDEPVLLEMEAEIQRRNFPAVGRNVGVTLEVLARASGAKRVFELGSGFGYSAYWFARAIGSDGELHLTDSDQSNADRAMELLSAAGLDRAVTYHVGDAVTALQSVDGAFDIIYNDIDKRGYPQAWRAASERVRVGGMYICDNVLWSSKVLPENQDPDDETAAIREHNDLIADDPRYVSTIIPTRDGVMVAVRVQ